MRHKLGLGLGCFTLTLASVAALSTSAAMLNVQNASFESPNVASTGYPALPEADDWTVDGSGTTVPGYGQDGAGIFTNVTMTPGETPGSYDPVLYPSSEYPYSGPYPDGHLDNVDGNQAAYIFSNQGNSISQPLVDTNGNPITFTAGESYTLSALVAVATTPPKGSDRLAFEIYYTDTNGNNHTVGEYDLSGDDASPQLSGNAMQSYSFTSPVLAADDPAVGQQIEIGFFALDNAPETIGENDPGEFDLDLVSVTSNTPEPACLTAIGACSILMLKRRRK